MRRGLLPLAALLTAGALSLQARPARAQAPNAALEQVKKAHADVDYENARELAAAAIRQGGNDRASTAELYWAWGMAAAALDQREEAHEAFMHALAANPERKLDRGLSPKLRAPYLEARGKLGAADARAPLEVTLQRRREQLELALHDALEVAVSIELGARTPGSNSFTRRPLPAAPLQKVPAPRAPELLFFVRVLDRYGNVLLELGTPSEPRRLSLATATSEVPTGAARISAEASRTPYYVVAGSLGALGLATSGVATAMYLRREGAARAWNDEACERPGATRAQQCRDVDDRRERAETLAVGFAAAGGALLIGSVVSLWLASNASRSQGVAVSAGPSHVSLGWQTPLQ